MLIAEQNVVCLSSASMDLDLVQQEQNVPCPSPYVTPCFQPEQHLGGVFVGSFFPTKFMEN